MRRKYKDAESALVAVNQDGLALRYVPEALKTEGCLGATGRRCRHSCRVRQSGTCQSPDHAEGVRPSPAGGSAQCYSLN